MQRFVPQQTRKCYNDLLIAAIAISHDLVLVTHNTKEFARVEGLKLEDWEIEV